MLGAGALVVEAAAAAAAAADELLLLDAAGAAGVLTHVPPWLQVICMRAAAAVVDETSTTAPSRVHKPGRCGACKHMLHQLPHTWSGQSASPSGQAALIVSRRTTLALRPALLVTLNVML
jgi:hypothetical protein